MAVDGHALTFGHDLLGREVSRVWGDPSTPVSLTTTWDDAGRPTAQSLGTGTAPSPLVTRDYSYRADGFPVAIGEQTVGTDRRVKQITIDPMGRPLTVADEGWTEQYAYDRAGNQDAAQWPTRAGRGEARGPRTYAGTRLLTAGAVHYTHDAAGRVVERRRTRPSRKPDLWRYTYDARDRLTSCTTPDGTLWTYVYDPLGRRTAKHRMADDGVTTVETIRYTWDGTVLAEQVDEATATALTWEYDGHRPLVQYERRLLDDAETDARFFAIVTDLAGTPID